MLIRDLVLQPRDPGNEYWQAAFIELVDGRTICIERPTATNGMYPQGTWFVIANWGTGDDPCHGPSEFEAQAAFDHYRLNVGFKNNPALKPSGDT